MENQNILVLDSITKTFSKRKILDSISFCAAQGDCIGILGANGTGKSTLLSILSGAIKADSGKLLFRDRNLFQTPKTISSYIGYVPQDNPLMDQMTVLDNLQFWYAGSSYSLKEELKNGIPAMFGLTSYLKMRVSKLSGGWKKRLSIACALANKPPVLLLDEPGASLDMSCKEDIKAYLTFYCEHGGMIILTTHEEGEIQICNKLFLLNDRQISPISTPFNKTLLMERIRKTYD